MKILVIICVFTASVHITEPILHYTVNPGPSAALKAMPVDLNTWYQFMMYQKFLADPSTQNGKRYGLSLEAADDNVAMVDQEIIPKNGNKVLLTDQELSRTKRAVHEWPLLWSRFRKTE